MRQTERVATMTWNEASDRISLLEGQVRDIQEAFIREAQKKKDLEMLCNNCKFQFSCKRECTVAKPAFEFSAYAKKPVFKKNEEILAENKSDKDTIIFTLVSDKEMMQLIRKNLPDCYKNLISYKPHSDSTSIRMCDTLKTKNYVLVGIYARGLKEMERSFRSISASIISNTVRIPYMMGCKKEEEWLEVYEVISRIFSSQNTAIEVYKV